MLNNIKWASAEYRQLTFRYLTSKVKFFLLYISRNISHLCYLFTNFHGSRKKLVDNIKTMVTGTIQRKWPEKSPGALRQRNKIKGCT